MNWAEICFCMDLPPVAGRPDGLDCGRVSALLAETLFAGNRGMGDVLAARYRQMAANFLDMPFDDPRWDLDVGGRDLPHDAHDNAALLSVPANLLDGCAAPVAELLGHANFGHDMPTWMVRRGVENPLRVMIVSQDPRRTGHPAGSLVLSTPFGFHSRDYRDVCCQNPVLCRLVERLLEADACVYLTDCMKFYTDDVVAGGRPPQNYVRANLRRYRGAVQGRTGRRDRGLRAGCHRDPRERGGRFCRHRASERGVGPAADQRKGGRRRLPYGGPSACHP